MAAYYVVSETLTNVAKHAGASVVQVDVATHDGTLTLTVRDDGVGGAALGQGSGLVGLEDRVEALGGTITVDSSPGSGTSVAVALPIVTEAGQRDETILRRASPEGCHYSCRSSGGGSVVLMDEAAEPVSALDVAGAQSHVSLLVVGWAQVERAMRSLPVVGA